MTRFQRVATIIALVICFATAVAGEIWQSSTVIPSTEQSQQQQSGTAAANKNPDQILDWNNWTHDPIAVFTGLLTLFNGLLFASTLALWLANRQSAKIAERALTELERAFVSLEGFIVELTTAADAAIPRGMIPEHYRDDPGLCLTRCALIPKWKNSGRTPTKNMTIQVAWGGPEWPVITIPDSFTYRNEPAPFFIPPGGEELSREMEIPPAQAIIDWSFRPVGAPPWILIWGRADYEDVFGKRHILEWCRQLRLDRHDGRTLRANFIQWGEYNRSYDPQESH